MIILIDSQGTVVSIVPFAINQGSVGVNEITVVAPFPSTAVCFAAYELPNGLYSYPQIVKNNNGTISISEGSDLALDLVDEFSGKLKTENGLTLNVWTATIKAPITQSSGNLGIQIFFADQYGNILSSSRLDFPVFRGIPFLNTTFSEADFNAIIAAVSAAQSAAQRAEIAAHQAGIEAIQNSYFTYVITELEEDQSISDILLSLPYESRVLIKGIHRRSALDDTIFLRENIKELWFSDCVLSVSHIGGDDRGETILRSDLTPWFSAPKISGFVEVTGFICSRINNCRFVRNCIMHNAAQDDIGGEITGCTSVSNIRKSYPGMSMVYNNCQYVDPFTCAGYVPRANLGMPIALGSDFQPVFIPITKGLGEGSVQGETCLSGTMQYKIAPENDTGNPFNAGEHTSFTIENYDGGLAVGDVLTFKFVQSFDEASTITSIDGSTIHFTPSIRLAGWNGDTTVENAYVRCSAKPLAGTVNVEKNQFAFGNECKALGYGAFAAGDNAIANGRWSTARGKDTFANFAATAEGYGCKAYGRDSHAQNSYTKAYGQSSTAMGNGTEANGKEQVVSGIYNEPLGDEYLHVVGNGTNENNKSNAYTLDRNGNGWFAGEVTVGEGKTPLLKSLVRSEITPAPASGYYLFYGVPANKDGMEVIKGSTSGTSASAATVAIRNYRGSVAVPTPVNDNESVPYSMYKALLARIEALEASLN